MSTGWTVEFILGGSGGGDGGIEGECAVPDCKPENSRTGKSSAALLFVAEEELDAWKVLKVNLVLVEVTGTPSSV